ncbi:MAG: TIGR01906 family membrane protein [Chloroflexi bacterium]|nr:TIGR01906 family membrane protein [Chloroflexota bacterium]
MRLIYGLLAVAAAVALPLALIGTNVRLAFNSLSLYTYAIDAFDAPARMELSRDELVRAARGVIAYFNSDEGLPTFTVRAAGGEEPFFSERESLHFRDVRSLLRRVYAVQTAALALVALAVGASAVAAARGKREYSGALARALRRSAYVTMAGIVAVGIVAALGGFQFLFLQFHLFGFSNDLWMGRATDRMVQMFPEEFFFQATMLIGLATAVEGAAVALLATVALRLLSKKIGRAPKPGPAPAKATGEN